MKRLFYCALIVLSIQLAAKAETPAEVVKARKGVCNYSRTLADSLKLGRGVDRRVKPVYFGNSFLYSPNVFTPKPNLIAEPAEAKEKSSSFTSKLHFFLERDLFPGAQCSHQLSTTDSPSWNGAFQINQKGILRQVCASSPKDASLFVLDFAYNDRGISEQTILASMEGMIHQIWKMYPNADIVLLYTPNKAFLKDYREGKEPQAITIHEKIAEHYGLASVNLAKFIADKIIAGQVKEADIFLGDNVVSDECDKLCVEAIKPLFVAGLEAAKKSPKIEAHAAPQPMGKYLLESPSISEYEHAQLEAGWIDWQLSPVRQFLHVLVCQEPGPVTTVRFKGNLFGMSMVVGPDSGDIEYSINGSPWQLKKTFIANSGESFMELPVLFAEGMDPSAEHELKLRVAPQTPAGSKGKVVRIAKLLVNGKIVFDDPWKGMTKLERIDKIYSELEPLKYKAPADRWQNIPNSMKKLAEGPSLTMVMLGDSIINDTCNSDFELLISRMYPKCKLNMVKSNRGGTGCHWYKLDNNVQEYVLRHKPDLLVIGGISNKGDTPQEAVESVREVIKQVRKAKPDIELLLMTGPFGYMQNPKLHKDWQEFVTPDGTDYRSCLLKVAIEEKADFLDMHGILGRYLLDSKFPCGSFQRDPVHANERGMQILGRILERYFEPKKD